MLRLTAQTPRVKVVFDQAGTPTYAADLAGAIHRMISSGHTGETKGLTTFPTKGYAPGTTSLTKSRYWQGSTPHG